MDIIIEVIDFAIKREQEAQEGYIGYARATRRQEFRRLLLAMADMEKEHERKLQELKSRGGLERVLQAGQPDAVRLSDYLVEMPFSPEIEYGDFLLLVVKKEEKAEKLYEKLEGLAADEETRWLFAWLKGEEQKHKAWARDRYDLEILTDN